MLLFVRGGSVRPNGHSLAVMDRVHGRYCVMTTRVGTGARLWNGPIALAFDWGGASDTRIEERLSD